jgi:signal transduction histidine kinase
MSTLGDVVASLTAHGRAVATYAPDDLAGRRMYMAVGAIFGVGSIIVNVLATPVGVLQLPDVAFMLVALILVTAIPLRPAAGLIAYQLCWIVLLVTPNTFASDMVIPNGAFSLFLGRFLPAWPAVSLFLMNVLVDVASALIPPPAEITATNIAGLLFNLLLCVLLLSVGMTLRSAEVARRREVGRAGEQLEEMRLEIAREMHDLVAYSMSQTALRARRAATDASYSPEAREEFAAVVSTASDALHELRLLLRALRQTTPAQGSAVATATGLGHAVVDLDAAVRAVSDDVSAAGFDVVFRCVGEETPSRLQASTMSRAAREMGANIIRHADRESPVTLTLALGPDVLRLVSTNGIAGADGSSGLPRSGTGILGMRERLAAIDGTLTTLAEDGSWMVAATVPLASSRPAPLERTA